jgi:hypothetical protein
MVKSRKNKRVSKSQNGGIDFEKIKANLKEQRQNVAAHIIKKKDEVVLGIVDKLKSPPRKDDDDDDEDNQYQDCDKNFAPYSSKDLCDRITFKCRGENYDTTEKYDKCIKLFTEAYDEDAFKRTQGISTEATIDVPQPGGRKTKRSKTKRSKTKRSKTKRSKTKRSKTKRSKS